MNFSSNLGGWNNIPLDTLMHISSYLSHDELFKVSSRVCKRWHQLRQEPRFWHLVFQSSESPFFKGLDSASHSLQTFNLYVSQVQSLKNLKLAHTILNLPRAAFGGEKIYRGSNCLGEFTRVVNQGYILPIFKERTTSCFLKIDLKATDLLSEHEGFGFFSAQGKESESYNRLIKIVKLSNLTEHSRIDLNDTLSPEELSDEYLKFQDCKAAFPLDQSQLLTISSYGIFAIWDIADIFHPKLISKVSFPKTETQRFIGNIFRQDQYVMIVEKEVKYSQRGPWIRVFDLKKKEIVNEICLWNQDSQDYEFTIFSNGKIVIVQNQNKIHAYQYEHSEKQFLKIWDQNTDSHTQKLFLSSTLPYLLVTTADAEKTVKNLNILNIHDGKSILNIPYSPVPCSAKDDTQCLYSHHSSNYKFMEDAVIRISDHQIDLWLIPSGLHQTIQLPLVRYNSFTHSNSLNEDVNAFWTKGSLIIKSPRQSSSHKIDHILEIYQAPKRIDSLSSSQTVTETIVQSRKIFGKFALNHLSMGLITYGTTLTFRVIRFISLFDFWNPRTSSQSFQAKLTRSTACLKNIVRLPLIFIGIEFAALYGVIAPYHGEKLLDFIQNWHWLCESDYAQKMLV